MKKFFVPFLIALSVFAVCIFALLPLFHAGYFTMHDDEQIVRLQQMYLVLSQGQIPPRWIPDLGFGFGYPLYNFYPPLVYYLGSLFHFIGFSFINATKIVMGIGFLGAALGMFVWARKHYGWVAGLFAALLYTYAPYHSVDLYVRGALSEFFSWIWIPFLFWSLDLLFEKLEKKYIFLFGVFFALLMLSHSLVMLQFGPIFIIYSAGLFLFHRKSWKKALLFLSGGVLLGLGLSAYFWLPSILEKQYTLVDAILTTQLASYVIHFICPIQLWSAQWGYGGSVAGCVDGLSFQIGKMQILVSLAGILLSIFYVLRKGSKLSLLISVLLLCSIFLTLPFSSWLWNLAKPFWYIQFPWRYLLFVAVFSSFLGGFSINFIQKKFGIKLAIVVAIILSLLALYQVRNDFRPQSYRYVTDRELTTLTEIQWRVSSMSYEYVPKEVATRLSSQDTTELAISENQLPKNSFSVIDGNMQIRQLANTATLKKYTVNVYNTKTQKGGTLQVNTYRFPGWQVFVDRRRVNDFIKNSLDLIQVQLPEGQHTVEVHFTNTPIRIVANSISLITIFGLFVSILWKKRRKI